jgi:hypothetical protein
MILLIGSLVVGLGVVGSCVSTSTGMDAAANGLVGGVFALLLVGAVFLLTTMSRDLRRLREKYVDEHGPARQPSTESASAASHALPPSVDGRQEKPWEG